MKLPLSQVRTTHKAIKGMKCIYSSNNLSQLHHITDCYFYYKLCHNWETKVAKHSYSLVKTTKHPNWVNALSYGGMISKRHALQTMRITRHTTLTWVHRLTHEYNSLFFTLGTFSASPSPHTTDLGLLHT